MPTKITETTRAMRCGDRLHHPSSTTAKCQGSPFTSARGAAFGGSRTRRTASILALANAGGARGSSSVTPC